MERIFVESRNGNILALFNIFLENIMKDTLEDHCSTISDGGDELCNLRFAELIDFMAGSNTELQELINQLCEQVISDIWYVGKLLE